MQRGDVDIAIEYNGDIVQIITECECDTFAYAIPVEGSNYVVDAVAIPSEAPNPALAHAFLDFILSPQAAADIANYTGYGSTNQAAIDLGLIDPVYYNDPGIYPPDEVIANLFLLEELSPEAESLYLDAWDEVLVSVEFIKFAEKHRAPYMMADVINEKVAKLFDKIAKEKQLTMVRSNQVRLIGRR